MAVYQYGEIAEVYQQLVDMLFKVILLPINEILNNDLKLQHKKTNKEKKHKEGKIQYKWTILAKRLQLHFVKFTLFALEKLFFRITKLRSNA